MKDGMESTAARRAPEASNSEPTPAPEPRENEPQEFINRKLIRPSLNRAHFQPAERPDNGQDRPERRERLANGDRSNNKKGIPQEQTHAESFYYQKQMQSRTPMVIVLKDGEEVQGWIEWYDRNCIKINRSGQPNLLIYKLNIKYMYKVSENARR